MQVGNPLSTNFKIKRKDIRHRGMETQSFSRYVLGVLAQTCSSNLKHEAIQELATTMASNSTERTLKDIIFTANERE